MDSRLWAWKNPRPRVPVVGLRFEPKSGAVVVVVGHYPGKPEVIVAHTSPTWIITNCSPVFSRPDALTILDQIDGSLIYLGSIAIRPDEKTHDRMVTLLESVRRTLMTRIDEPAGGQCRAASTP